jgi:hypothetical protein
MVALYAQQTFVDFCVSITGNRDDFSLIDANLNVAPGPAKPTRRLVPLDAAVRRIGIRDRRRIRGPTSTGYGGRCGGHGGRLQKLATISVHIVSHPS